jgi:hypothetical protein
VTGAVLRSRHLGVQPGIVVNSASVEWLLLIFKLQVSLWPLQSPIQVMNFKQLIGSSIGSGLMVAVEPDASATLALWRSPVPLEQIAAATAGASR